MPARASVVPRAARPPGADWKDSYFSLEVRYQQLRKLLNAKEEELKLLKVSHRKSKTSTASDTRRPSNRPSSLNRETHADSSLARASKAGPASSRLAQSPPQKAEVVVASLGSRTLSGPTFESHLEAMLGRAAKLPDPAMIWGSESNVNNYIIASALYHANQELQNKLNESSTLVKTLQHELSSSRTLCANSQARIEDLAQQIHQLVRERDLASQKLATSQQSVKSLERTLQNHIEEESKLRFSLETQISELRSRLVVGVEANELLNKDVRSLLSDAKEKEHQLMGLQSKLALAETALTTQRNANENLLLELNGLNRQLVEERKRVLASVRELELAQVSKSQIKNLESQVRRLTEERNSIECEHAKLLSEYAHSTQEVLSLARQETQADVADFRHAAQHWEGLAQLLYKDIAERTQNHQRCRAECEEAKAQRDRLSMELRQAVEELRLYQAKLGVVWPNHNVDSAGLSLEEVLGRFKSQARPDFVGSTSSLVGVGPASMFTATGTASRPPPAPYAETTAELERGLPIDSATATEQIHELHEANAALLAEIERLRLANELHLSRIEAMNGRHAEEKQRMVDATHAMESREAVGRALLQEQLDRVQFLESQIRSLRGYHVSPGTALEMLSSSETVLELFLGQMVATAVPEGVPVPETFSQMFCSVDFLLHHTVTTPPVHGLNGFFDTTISFRIAMDALLLYYLRTRQLLVQLHRVRAEGAVCLEEDGQAAGMRNRLHRKAPDPEQELKVTEGSFETVAEGRVSLLDLVTQEDNLCAARPALRGHIKLLRLDETHMASLEFFLTVRTPFSEAFRDLVRRSLLPPTEGSVAPPLPLAASNSPWNCVGECSPPPPLPGGGQTSPGICEGESSPPPPPAGSTQDGPTPYRDSDLLRTPVSIQHVPEGSSPHPPRQVGLLQLIPAHAGRSVTPTASLRSSDYTTTSVSHSSRTSVLQDSAARRRLAVKRLQSDDFSGLRLRQSPSSGVVQPVTPRPLVSRDTWLPQMGNFAAATQDATVNSGGLSFVHIPKTLLRPSLSRSPDASAAGVMDLAVHAIAIEAIQVELPGDLPPPIPRLSCRYTVPALGHEVHLPAPAQPQSHICYPSACSEKGAPLDGALEIRTLAELARLAREPLLFFLIDEDAGGGNGIWAMALCECAPALAQPGRAEDCVLPLWRPRDAVTVGERHHKAVLRVRLTAFAGRDGGELAIQSDPLTHPRPAPPAGVVSVGPDKEAAQVASSFSGLAPVHPESDTVPTFEEELMRLEYEKHLRKGLG